VQTNSLAANVELLSLLEVYGAVRQRVGKDYPVIMKMNGSDELTLRADPFLYRHMREGVQEPQCDFCNACYSRAAVWPVDCYNEEVRAQRDRMLRAEAP